MQKKRWTTFDIQKNLSIIYIMLTILMLVICSYLVVKRYSWGGFLEPEYIFGEFQFHIYLLFLLCNIVTYHFDARWARILQTASFIVQSCYSLIGAVDSFYGWALGLVGVLLMHQYKLFTPHSLPKLILLYLLFLGSCIVSAIIRTSSMYQIFTSTIFLIFILSFILIIIRNEIADFLFEKAQAMELKDKVVVLTTELEEQQKVFQKKEQVLIKRLNDMVQQVPTVDTNREKQIILADLTKLSSEQRIIEQQMHLNQMENDIRNSMLRIPEFQSCTERELELIVLFYFHRGKLTNKELGVLLNSSESNVKNTMRTLFQKLEGVNSRTSLLAFIDDSIDHPNLH